MVNISKLKLTNLQQNILRLFFIKSGTSLNALAVAKALKVSQPAVSKALPYLEKEGFLRVNKDKESKRLSIDLKTEDHKIIWLKRADNLKQIYESGIIQFFYDKFPSATIILFGSYAFGEDIFNSDIDFAVIGAKKEEINLTEFEKKLSRTIRINYYKNFKDLDKNFLNNLLNGIILKGSVEI